ncbi:uncharacterized protein [Bemisia tabaci]|uniref:uncharacterized protein n=1 Tax=Bemisia tabaci TaxID=7038 RepID=UPI003B28153D
MSCCKKVNLLGVRVKRHKKGVILTKGPMPEQKVTLLTAGEKAVTLSNILILKSQRNSELTCRLTRGFEVSTRPFWFPSSVCGCLQLSSSWRPKILPRCQNRVTLRFAK